MGNHWSQNSKFEEYEQALGSRYAAIIYISQVARHRAKSVHNCITESQALSWVITGIEPKCLRERLKEWRRRKNADLLYAKDRLLYIVDDGIREATWETILESRRTGYLIYKYKDIVDEPLKARVRILSNIIWDEMRNIRIQNLI